MSELNLELDQATNETFRDLMQHYGVSTKAEIVKKGISLLKIAAYIDSTDGELIARKAGMGETRLHIR